MHVHDVAAGPVIRHHGVRFVGAGINARVPVAAPVVRIVDRIDIIGALRHVDLGKIETVRSVSTGFLQDQNSWIFMPVEVEYSLSVDGIDFVVVAVVRNDVSPREEGAIIKEFTDRSVDRDARYVKVRAKNRGVCPDWHKGAGGKAWIFIDEIIIE